VEKAKVIRNARKEDIGWASMILFLFLFPALFFACAFLPMWIGVAGW
jgi:hypothetical protein